MDGVISPKWTTRLPQASTRDPLRVDSGRGSVRNRLFPQLSAVASRTRLRYVSFLVWCLDNRAHDLDPSIELFETQFLLGSTACSLDTGPTGGSGFVGTGRDVTGTDYSIGDLVDREEPPIDISPERVRIHTGSQRFSDRYARMANDLCLVEPSSDELTPLGEKVAAAYDDAVDVSFDNLAEQARDTTVSSEFLQSFSGTGCACSLSKREIQLYRRLFFGLYDRTHANNTEKLRFIDTPPSQPADLTSILDRYYQSSENPELDSLMTAFAVENRADSFDDSTSFTKYDQFVKGERTLARCSFLFVLALALQHNEGRDKPVLGDLSRIGDLWAVHNLSRRFVSVNEQLLELVIELLRICEPITSQSISRWIVDSDSFGKTLETVPSNVEILSEESEEYSTNIGALRQAATYGEWFLTQPQVCISLNERPTKTGSDGSKDSTISWNEMRAQLEGNQRDTRISLDERSPWVLFRLFVDAVDDATSAAKSGRNQEARQASGRAIALAAQLFGRWQSWYNDYLQNQSDGNISYWMDSQFESPPSSGSPPASRSISPRLLWEFPYDPSNEVDDIMAAYLETYIIQRYVSVMYRKYRENGRAPTFLTVDDVGQFYFEASYTTAGPNENIYKQVVDVLCELELIETNDRTDIRVTENGIAIVDRLCEEHPVR